jgi:hypothetical protein
VPSRADGQDGSAEIGVADEDGKIVVQGWPVYLESHARGLLREKVERRPHAPMALGMLEQQLGFRPARPAPGAHRGAARSVARSAPPTGVMAILAIRWRRCIRGW